MCGQEGIGGRGSIHQNLIMKYRGAPAGRLERGWGCMHTPSGCCGLGRGFSRNGHTTPACWARPAAKQLGCKCPGAATRPPAGGRQQAAGGRRWQRAPPHCGGRGMGSIACCITAAMPATAGGGAPGATTAATAGFCPVMGTWLMKAAGPAEGSATGGATVVMSWMDARRLSFLFWELRRIKYFWACEATCGGEGVWGSAGCLKTRENGSPPSVNSGSLPCLRRQDWP